MNAYDIYVPCKLCCQAKWMPTYELFGKDLQKLHDNHKSDEAVHTLNILRRLWSAFCIKLKVNKLRVISHTDTKRKI